MTINTYYVKAKSKKAINEALAAGKPVVAEYYGFMQDVAHHDITTLNDGDMIKVYEKTFDGSPYAKAYGNWNVKSQRVK